MSLVNKAKKLKEESTERIKFLEELVDEQERRIAALAKQKFRMPKLSGKSLVKGSSYVRIALPDTHGCYIDQTAWNAVLADLAALGERVSEVVLLGDHLDCGGFLAEHHTVGYVAEADYSYDDDINSTNTFLDQLQFALPRAKYHYLEGNHEHRVEKWCATEAPRNKQDAERLRRQNSFENVLHLEKRGISAYRWGVKYGGIEIPATIRLDQCYFTHGSRTGPNAARNMLNDFSGNVVFGHTHQNLQAVKRTVRDGLIGAWSIACLCRLQALWNHTQITAWSHAYGLQIVAKDRFLHLTVPIIDGKSLMPLLLSRMI